MESHRVYKFHIREDEKKFEEKGACRGYSWSCVCKKINRESKNRQRFSEYIYVLNYRMRKSLYTSFIRRALPRGLIFPPFSDVAEGLEIPDCRGLMAARKIRPTCSHYKLYRLIEFLFDFLPHPRPSTYSTMLWYISYGVAV